ncbi:hypothetical protein QQS21_011254 [Conoideocrella luteorostrata]|uniref:Uncharacterized protein n=1 Tax=Conoideocrella luteorostrata TaxID=1105319 RepID=A0AAJ0FTW8_9HYPO|nr:hypothetical protein QQS21_011254 [Conoideocrella luteorostrata]
MAAENPTSDAPENTFKDQLDKAAVEQRERDQDPKPHPVVEKITEFIPAASKILGPKEHPKKDEPQPPGPPERPDHDPKIERFVRDQHRSKQPGGDLTEVTQD